MADSTHSSEDELQFQVDDILTGAVSITTPKLSSTSRFTAVKAVVKRDDSPLSEESDARPKTPVVMSSFAAYGRADSFSSDTPHTGIDRLDQDLSEVYESFDLEVEEKDGGHVIHCSLPIFRPSFRAYMSMDVCVMSVEGSPSYSFQFIVKAVQAHLHLFTRSQIPDCIEERVSLERINAFLNGLPPAQSLLQSIESLYVWLEDIFLPRRVVKTRDFFYAVYDPRHWGRRPIDSNAARLQSSRGHGRILYSYTDDAQLARLQVDDIVTVVADLGDGWLTIRRGSSLLSSSRSSSRSASEGELRIPREYVRRINE